MEMVRNVSGLFIEKEGIQEDGEREREEKEPINTNENEYKEK